MFGIIINGARGLTAMTPPSHLLSDEKGGDFGFESRRVHMASCKSIYDPQEDSTMLERWVRLYAQGKVLDIGTGSGIQAIAAAQSPRVKSVLATDIQKGVIDYCRKCIKNKKIKFLASGLFENIKKNEKFDMIIFNPPYLPQELKLKDLTLEGGKKGYEIIQKFINEVNEFLSKDGIVLMVFSSLTKKEKVEEFIRNNLLEFESLEKMHIFFEDIHVYLLKKSEFLKKLENKGLINVKYFAKGHRGVLFTGNYRNKKVAVKSKNPKSAAFGRIENEAKWLKKLNKYCIGPELLFSEDYYFVYKYIYGDFIIDYIKKSNKIKIKKILKNIFRQLFDLDKLKIDKEEMHRPVKHIIISKQKPYLIDFERAHYAQSPKNITQFCQFLISEKMNYLLENKGIKIGKSTIIGMAKVYKKNINNRNFNNIIGSI